MLAWIVLALASIAVFIFSWPFLRSPRSHGFFRFFAFECCLALVALQVSRWFREPFSAHQIASWVLLIGSAFLAAHGFYLLRKVGRPRKGIEDTTQLVRVGAYRTIRHPLYSSLLLLAWGTFFKGPSLLGGALAAAATGFLVATARTEEAENLQKFGAEYAAYMEETRMFLPFLF